MASFMVDAEHRVCEHVLWLPVWLHTFSCTLHNIHGMLSQIIFRNKNTHRTRQSIEAMSLIVFVVVLGIFIYIFAQSQSLHSTMAIVALSIVISVRVHMCTNFFVCQSCVLCWLLIVVVTFLCVQKRQIMFTCCRMHRQHCKLNWIPFSSSLSPPGSTHIIRTSPYILYGVLLASTGHTMDGMFRSIFR